MKKLIVGLIFMGLLLSPFSVVKAQVVTTDREAILAQLNLIYAQLVQLLSQLQAQLETQITAQSAEIQNISQSQMSTNTKLDKVVENTTPATSAAPEPTPPAPEPVLVRELVVKAFQDSVKVGGDIYAIVQIQENGRGIDCHNHQLSAEFKVDIKEPGKDSRDMFPGRRLCPNTSGGLNVDYQTDSVAYKNLQAVIKGGAIWDFGYNPQVPGVYKFTVTTDDMTKSIEVTVTE